MKTAKELWDKYKNITPLRMTALSERDNELISEIEKKIKEWRTAHPYNANDSLGVKGFDDGYLSALTEIINLIKET